MKPFLGIDLTIDKKNEKCNGDKFLIATPSYSATQLFNESSKETEEVFEKIKMPLFIRIIKWACAILGFSITMATVKYLLGDDAVSFVKLYSNIAWIFWFGGICVITFIILSILGNKKAKKLLGSNETIDTLTDYDNACDTIYKELEIPLNSKEVDILLFCYKEKDGNIKVCEKDLQASRYLNPIFNIFVDPENLYLANLEGKYSFPLSSLASIKTVKKSICIIDWNKDEEINSDVYKRYKLVRDKYGCVHCKSYCILELKKE